MQPANAEHSTNLQDFTTGMSRAVTTISINNSVVGFDMENQVLCEILIHLSEWKGFKYELEQRKTFSHHWKTETQTQA